MKIAIIAITTGGRKIARQLKAALDHATIISEKGVGRNFAKNWQSFDGFIGVMATGIAVRSIGPLLVDKQTDPCVVVVDEKGRHAISLLSGHLGGGNDLASQVAAILGGTPVITTASDTLGVAALDVWARDQHLVASKEVLTHVSGILVNNRVLHIYTDLEVQSLPAGLKQTNDMNQADLIISNQTCYGYKPVFCPQNIVVGTGCNRGTPVQEFDQAMHELCLDLGLNQWAIRNLASIDKKNDEAGLLTFARHHNWQIYFYSKDEINRITDVTFSKAAMKAVGAIGVAEPCALLSATLNPNKPQLISRKRKWQNITMAVAEIPFTLSAQAQDH